MATYDVTAQTRRLQFTGNGTALNASFSFQINATSQGTMRKMTESEKTSLLEKLKAKWQKV